MRRSVLSTGVRVVAALAVGLAGACSASHSATLSLGRARTGSIEWTPCGETIQCATLAVPLDRAHPAKGTINLALARRPASGERIGVLFTNPGGPGGSGVDFLRAADDEFPREIRDAFDLVSWDPRGVGQSAPVKCLPDLDAFYAIDRDPSTPGGVNANVAMAKKFVAACAKNSGRLLPFVSTDATVHDMDAIRAAMGETKVSYVGFSYGTEIGAMYANEFPTHVRAMVLDGAVDPAVDANASIIDQSRSFEHDLEAFLDHCRSSGCGFAQGADPAVAFDSMISDLTAEPEPGTVKGEPRTLGPGEFNIGVASALYSGEAGWHDLGTALAQAATGEGSAMLSLSDDYTGRSPGGKYTSETAATYAIGCLDGPSPPTIAAVEKLAADAQRVAPHFGAATAYLNLPCTFWPVRPVGKVGPIAAPNAPAIVVVGTTNDPATPYEWADALARELQSGHLVTVQGNAHTAYGQSNRCVDTIVDKYLLALTVPTVGARCA